MLPIDLRSLQDLAARAIASLASALGDAAEDSQRGYLLEAMRALDDIEATLDTAFEMTLDPPDSDGVVANLRVVSGGTAPDDVSRVA